MTDGLSISRIVNGTLNLSPPLAEVPNFNTLLVVGTSGVIDTVKRGRTYNRLSDVGLDFATNSEEYLSAAAWFGQTPKPNSIVIGRWAKTDTSGELVGGVILAANQVVGPWNAIADGAFQILVDGVGPTVVGNLDFSASANMNAVAAVIESGFPGGTADVVWDPIGHKFVITSTSTGAASSISFATPPNAGTDISAIAGLTAGTAGAYVVQGIVAESALAAVEAIDTVFGSAFYGIVIPSAVVADHEAVAAWTEAADPSHFYGVLTQDVGVLDPTSTTDLAYLLKQLGYTRTAVQYSSSSLYAISSLLSRILTTNWAGNNTAITLMFKQEPGIAPELLSSSQMDALLAKNCNVFVRYNNNTAIIQPGITPSGQFVDTTIGCDWLRAQIQTNLYDLLFGSATKIPQTDQGMHQLATGIEAACVEAVGNGLVAPGQWSAGGFGQLVQGQFLAKGYYIFTPPIATQSAQDRAARKSVPFQIAVKLGGAVHEVDFTLNVNP